VSRWLRQKDPEFKASLGYVANCIRKERDEHQWFMPEILATQEAEISRLQFEASLSQTVPKTLSQNNPITKVWQGGSNETAHV
jgi:hypothetical protein